MRIQRNHFDTEQQATDARKEFPYCGVCSSALKIQESAYWWLMCMRNAAHRSISSKAPIGRKVVEA